MSAQQNNVQAIPLDGQDAKARKFAEERARILNALKNNEPVQMAQGGKVVNKDPNAATFNSPSGIFAAQWYEKNPDLLRMEQLAMSRNFPQFRLDKLDDGRLCWIGKLEPGIYESKYKRKLEYHIMAVYNNNHPNQEMGSSVRVYPLVPDIDEIFQMGGFVPSHLIRDENGDGAYLCTNRASDQKVGRAKEVGGTTDTAASILSWAVKWFTAFEFVLIGELSKEEFNEHNRL